MNRLHLLLLALLTASGISAQRHITLDLQSTIEIASDSSLQAFRSQNLYMSGYWEYVSFKAGRLPSLSLNLTPASYNQSVTREFDNTDQVYRYYSLKSYSASGGLNIVQNFDPLGGTFYVESSLAYMRNFGHTRYTQYSAIPVRIGYRQDLLGFNQFRWERRIEPVKYEKVKKEFLYNMEEVSETAVNYFFNLALAQAEYRLAKDNLASADTIYTVGERRFKIASISQADLLTLRLDKVNAENTLANTRIALKRAMFSLASFLGMDKTPRSPYSSRRCPPRERSIRIWHSCMPKPTIPNFSPTVRVFSKHSAMSAAHVWNSASTPTSMQAWASTSLPTTSPAPTTTRCVRTSCRCRSTYRS